MKILFNSLRAALLLCSAAFILTGCNEDDALNITNENNLNTELVINDPNLQEQAVIATYSPSQTIGMYGRFGFWMEDHMGDELQLAIDQPTLQRISDHLLDGSTEANTKFYIALFQGVARANNVITSVGDWNGDAEKLRQLDAEGRFMRAFYYYYLVVRFGEVPLQLGLDTEFKPKSPIGPIWDLIVEDLTFAADNLPTKNQQQIGRPTNETAAAFLGRAYLHREQWQEAYDAFDRVVSYSLSDEYVDNFNTAGEYNDESLFEIGFLADAPANDAWGSENGAGNVETSFRSVEYSGWSNARPSDIIYVEAYEEGDPRKDETWWEPGDVFGGEAGLIWGTDAGTDGRFGGPRSGVITSRKYSEYIENTGQTTEGGVNPRIMRYADVLLMKAEAALRLNRLDEAVSLMNEVRARPSVNMPPYGSFDTDIAGYPVNTAEEIFNALVHERQVELAMEGKRIVDLQRWGIDVEVLQRIKSNYTSERRYLPIPARQVDTNPFIGG